MEGKGLRFCFETGVYRAKRGRDSQYLWVPT